MRGSAAAGVIVSVLIIVSIAAIGYYQFVVAPNLPTSTTTSSSTTTSLVAGHYVNITIPQGAASPPGPGYAPASVTVVLGKNSTVVWKNTDPAIHTVTANTGVFDSGNMNAGDSFTYTFTKAGTYSYRCIYHSWMLATIVVKSA